MALKFEHATCLKMTKDRFKDKKIECTLPLIKAKICA